jgi:hypothetical protein
VKESAVRQKNENNSTKDAADVDIVDRLINYKAAEYSPWIMAW